MSHQPPSWRWLKTSSPVATSRASSSGSEIASPAATCPQTRGARQAMPMATKASCTGRAQTGRLQPRRRIRARTETRPASSTTRRCRIGPAAGAATSREIRSFPASPRCLGRWRRRHGHPRGKLCPPRPPRSPFLVGHHRDASRSLGHFMHAVTGHQTCRRATRRHLVGSPSRTPLRSAAQTAGSPASATCCPGIKPPTGSGPAAAASPRARSQRRLRALAV